MYRIIPIDLTAAGCLISSTISEPRASEPPGRRVRYTVGQNASAPARTGLYECVAAHTGSTPPENDATTWLDVRPTLKWAPFDGATTAAARADRHVYLCGAAGILQRRQHCTACRA